jgi:hypothetical protein
MCAIYGRLARAVGAGKLVEIARAGYAEASLGGSQGAREAAVSLFLADAVLGAHAMTFRPKVDVYVVPPASWVKQAAPNASWGLMQ